MPDASQYESPAQKPANDRADLTGRTLGDFLLLRKLGQGGMGQVYLSRQLSLKREVALKLLRDDLNANATALMRFQAEAEAVARLSHANIVQVYAIGEHDGLRYMALEFVDGRNLREYLARKGPSDSGVSLSIMRQVLLALQKAHEQGIVHRDIKPENILVTKRVEVKVTDFGLSRFFTADTQAVNLTQSGVTVGTPLYMSPEQVQGQTVDHRSDLYSFGVTCYHLLTGEPPFRGTTAFDVALKHVQEAPQSLASIRPDLPAELGVLVHKLMAKSPADRYASARDVLRDLTRVREAMTQRGTVDLGRTVVTPIEAVSTSVLSLETPTPVPAPTRAPSSWRRWALGGVICFAAAAAGAGLELRSSSRRDISRSGDVGLVDLRGPERPSVARERKLTEIIGRSDTKPDDFLAASIELGLLHLAEHRYEMADDRFRKLEAEGKFPGIAGMNVLLAGKLGRAVVEAYRDKPGESNRVFDEVLRDRNLMTKQIAAGVSTDQQETIVYQLLLKYPGLYRAVCESLHRNQIGIKDLPPTVAKLYRRLEEKGPARS